MFFLFGWQHSRQPIRKHFGKSIITDMDFNVDSLSNPGSYSTNNTSILNDVIMWDMANDIEQIFGGPMLRHAGIE